MVVNNLDNFSGNMANGLDGYFNQDGAAQGSVSIEGLTCEELSGMYVGLQEKMAIVAKESEGKQFIVDPLAQYRAEMDFIISRMVNMGCQLPKSNLIYTPKPPVGPDNLEAKLYELYGEQVNNYPSQTFSTQFNTVSANPADFQKNAYMRRVLNMDMRNTMGAVNNSMHTTANKGKGAIHNIGNGIQKVGASAITLVNDALNGLFCGIGLTQLGNCKKDAAAGIQLDAGYSNAAGRPCDCSGSSPRASKNTPCKCDEKNIGGRKSRADLFSNADGNGTPCGCKGKASGNNAPCPCMSGKPCPCQSGAPCGCQGKEKSMPNLIKPVNNHF